MLDDNKRERDRQIDEADKTEKQERPQENADAVPPGATHPQRSKKRREVTDPTTGRDVEIDDVDKDFLKAVKDPQVVDVPSIKEYELISREALRTKCESQQTYCEPNTRTSLIFNS
jgi:hypothetical protein